MKNQALSAKQATIVGRFESLDWRRTPAKDHVCMYKPALKGVTQRVFPDGSIETWVNGRLTVPRSRSKG